MPTFRTQAQIESQLAWPIGFPSRAARDAKFASPRCEAPPDAAAAGATLYRSATTNVAPGDYAPPGRALGLQILPMDKPCLRYSAYLADYAAPGALHARLRALQPGALEAAFAALDARGEGEVLLSELRMLLVHAFAASGLGEPEEAIVATLANLYEREGARRSDGAVVLPLAHVLAGVAACADMLAEEAALGRPEVLARTSSLAVKEARARDRALDAAPSLEGPPRPRLPPPPAPLASPHATLSPARAAASSPRASAAEAAAARESLRRSAPAGATLALDAASGLLLASPASGARLLTAGPLGDPSASPKATGMNLGALRAAQLTGEAVLGGRAPPAAAPHEFRLAGAALCTSGMRDYGDYGSAPAALDIAQPGIAGFAQTVRELAAGSTRQSRHPPHYTGHVPKEPHGASAEFGLGATARNSFHRSTNLIDNFASRVSGYTGYLPKAALNQTVDVDKVRGVEADSEYDHNVSARAGVGGGGNRQGLRCARARCSSALCLLTRTRAHAPPRSSTLPPTRSRALWRATTRR